MEPSEGAESAKRPRGSDAVVAAASATGPEAAGGIGGIFQEGYDEMGCDENEGDDDDGAKPPEKVFAPMSRLAAISLECIELISAH